MPARFQNGDPVADSRIRVKLPDGTTKEAATDADGELFIPGLAQDGNADITFLDHCKPGKAEAPEWPGEKQFKATVVDEIGNPVSGIWLWFRHGNAGNLARTDGSGVAKYKTSSDIESVTVSFESADDATTGTTRPKATLEPFFGAATTVDNPVTLSVQPLVIAVRMLGERSQQNRNPAHVLFEPGRGERRNQSSTCVGTQTGQGRAGHRMGPIYDRTDSHQSRPRTNR